MLPATRALSAFIVPFLVVAFVVLYGFPDATGRLFAWKIAPPMTAMSLGAVYLGGAYFFVRAFRAGAWHAVKAGFVAVGTFAAPLTSRVLGAIFMLGTAGLGVLTDHRCERGQPHAPGPGPHAVAAPHRRRARNWTGSWGPLHREL